MRPRRISIENSEWIPFEEAEHFGNSAIGEAFGFVKVVPPVNVVSAVRSVRAGAVLAPEAVGTDSISAVATKRHESIEMGRNRQAAELGRDRKS